MPVSETLTNPKTEQAEFEMLPDVSLSFPFVRAVGPREAGIKSGMRFPTRTLLACMQLKPEAANGVVTRFARLAPLR